MRLHDLNCDIFASFLIKQLVEKSCTKVHSVVKSFKFITEPATAVSYDRNGWNFWGFLKIVCGVTVLVIIIISKHVITY